MRVSNTTPKKLASLVAAFMSLTFGTFSTLAAEAGATETKPYEWSASLVSFDQATNTAVLRARSASHVKIDGLDDFEEGDRLILTWSGRSWASGVRDLARDPELNPDTLSLPVEFVSSDMDGTYINFRIPVPESAIETISGFEAGTYVTGMSPRMAADWNNGVMSLRHYNDVD